MNDQWNSALTDNVYISKRSFRKTLICKRRYVPVESNFTEHETKRENPNQSSCEKRETKIPSVQETICLNPRIQATHHSLGRSEESSQEEERVNEAEITATGPDPKPQLTSPKKWEEGGIPEVEIKQEVHISKPCAQGEQKSDDEVNRPKQVLKSQFVFASMKKRGREGDTEDRPHKCTYCNWAFKKSSNLSSHMKTHCGLRPHVCDVCGKAYSHQGTLQQHKRLHTGERPYQCPFCEKTYIWSSDFRKHVRTHTGEKPYICEECGKDFVRSSDLRKHMRNVHANDKPFLCKQCGKTFNKPLSLLRHERTHLGERPFLCPECGRSFAQASRMAEHRKIHSGVRPYMCPVCPKAFTKSSNLAEHLTVHTGVRPHKCSECGVAFAMASRLVRHQRTHAAK
nr:zinc finger protein 648 [Misgurnus anguillicaudatus]